MRFLKVGVIFFFLYSVASFAQVSKQLAKGGEVELLYLKPVRSYGLTGKQETTRLKQRYGEVNTGVEYIFLNKLTQLNTTFFVPTTNVVYHPVVIVDFPESGNAGYIRDVAKKMGLITPPVELASLLREAVSDGEIKKMGKLALIVMHESVDFATTVGGNFQIGLTLDAEGLGSFRNVSTDGWYRRSGFVFLAPQK